MPRGNLSEKKQKEYDALTAKMMREIEEELAKLPERKEGQLDGPRSKVYRDISNKYLSEIGRILGRLTFLFQKNINGLKIIL